MGGWDTTVGCVACAHLITTSKPVIHSDSDTISSECFVKGPCLGLHHDMEDAPRLAYLLEHAYEKKKLFSLVRGSV